MRWTVLGLLTGASALVGCSLAVVAVLGPSLAGCYIDGLPLSRQNLCGSGLWGAEWVPIALLTLGAAVTSTACTLGSITLVRQFRGAGRLARNLQRHAVPTPDRLTGIAARHGIPPVVYIDLDEPLAITVGALRPRIIISRGICDLLDDAELEAVLLHEATHSRRRHPAMYGVARLAAATAVVAPALQPVADAVVLRAEMDADSGAVGVLGRRPLVSALSKLIDFGIHDRQVAVGSVHGMLDQRIRALAGLPPLSDPRRQVALSAATALGLAILPAGTVALAFLATRGLL